MTVTLEYVATFTIDMRDIDDELATDADALGGLLADFYRDVVFTWLPVKDGSSETWFTARSGSPANLETVLDSLVLLDDPTRQISPIVVDSEE